MGTACLSACIFSFPPGFKQGSFRNLASHVAPWTNLSLARNPPRTPTINLFQVRQLDTNGTLKSDARSSMSSMLGGSQHPQFRRARSSRMISGYEIVPELVNPMVMQALQSLPQNPFFKWNCGSDRGTSHLPLPHRCELGDWPACVLSSPFLSLSLSLPLPCLPPLAEMALRKVRAVADIPEGL